jgi:hypothetical protein
MSERDFDDLEYADVEFYAGQIDKENARRTRETMTAAAFTAWAQGAGGDKNFGDFMDYYGLTEKEPAMSREELKKLAEKNIAIAERITRMAMRKS